MRILQKRVTYLPIELYEKLPWIKGKQIEDINSLRAISSESDFNLLTITKLLFCLKQQPLTFSELYYKSGCRMKSVYLKYLNFCQYLGFIRKLDKDGLYQPYAITGKGNQLWEMLNVAS